MRVYPRPSLPQTLSKTLSVALLALSLAGCSGISNPFSSSSEQPPPAPAVVPTLPPSFPPQDLVGHWGLAAYHKEEDKARTEAAAINQCKQPYIITMGAGGGVMMHLADQATPTDLRVKGAPGGKNFIGPADDPPGSPQDREVVSFDGRILILHWMDPEVQGRYGNMVYVRCPPEGEKRPKPKGKKIAAKPNPGPKAAPRAAPKPVQPPIQQIAPAR